MNKKYFVIPFCALLLSCNQSLTESPATETDAPDYLNTQLSVDSRAADLVSRMTISEKIAQMYNDTPAIERLGVPKYDYWNEALHGIARAGKATVFPQAIGMAAMWDEALMLEVATAISDEGRAKYHYFLKNDIHNRYAGLTFWSPNINIFRDPRWGRGQETYGEDPYLTGQLAIQFINGLQGDDDKYLKTAATAKHFAVHNGPEISRHSDNYVVSDKDLYETYLPAFEKAIVEADVEAVMCAYNRVNDQPACGSNMLLKEILRGKYRFDGHVMSDCGAIADFYDTNAHGVVSAPAEAAAWAVRTGTDLNCGTGRLSTFANLHFALQRGLISENEIDTAVERLFKTRFKLGMFDPQENVPYSNIPISAVGSARHLALAGKATEQSLVLLKNDGVLPLKKDMKVAVIGPNANNPSVLLGNYNGEPISPVTPLEGITAYAGEDNVSYAPGSAIIADIYGHYQVIGAENFFHLNDNNQVQPGLIGNYYKVERKPIEDWSKLREAMAGLESEPEFSRVDENIDFYWQQSPLDQKVAGSLGIKWKGLLVPQTSGVYHFESGAKITIDGEPVTAGVELVAGQQYQFEAIRVFPGSPWDRSLELKVVVRWVNQSRDLLAEALSVSEKADVLVVLVGISPRIEGEEMRLKLDGFNFGDRTDINLPDEQQVLIKALHELGKPMVLVNFSGSAMALNWENENLNGIIQAFYPGEATGTALARLLWGEYSPSGRLPVTFYKNLDGFADFTDYSMANRTYKYYKDEVLFPFGFGLSYSDFSYTNLSVPGQTNKGEGIAFSVELANTGKMDSNEITQVYVSLVDAPVRVPQVELKAFKRSTIASGDMVKLEFNLSGEQLTYVDADGKKQPYTGTIKLTVGSGQPGYVLSSQIQHALIEIQ